MKYELGQKNEGPGCCAPMASESGEGKMHYPSLYFTGDSKMDIPEEGTAVITFRKVDSGENTRDPDDPKYRCEIEVHSIAVKEAKKEDGLKVSLGDKIKAAMEKKSAYREE